MPVFDFENASIKGDPRWAAVSRATGYAPIVVITLAVLSIIQIVVGAIWVASISSSTVSLNFGQIVQPLIVPGLSFFNTIPSLHLHVLARSNSPKLALWFSTLLSLCYLASSIIYLAACPGSIPPLAAAGHQSSFQRTECPAGARGDVWGAMVGLQLLSCVGYAVHAGMAWWVRHVTTKEGREVELGLRTVVVDEEQKRRDEEEARRRWAQIRDL